MMCLAHLTGFFSVFGFLFSTLFLDKKEEDKDSVVFHRNDFKNLEELLSPFVHNAVSRGTPPVTHGFDMEAILNHFADRCNQKIFW